MKAAHMKQKIVIPALVGMMMIPGSAVYAADQKAEVYPVLPAAGIETVVTDCYETKVKENLQLYLVPTGEGEYLNMAFSNTGEEFTYIRSAPDENSDWIGKLYPDSAVRVLEYKEDWVKIQSGDAQGFVPADTLYLGEDAKSHAGEYEKEVATVTADVLNVRAGQGVETQVLTQIMQNQEYEITGEPKDGWYPVHAGEIAGWVSGEYISIETTYSYAETREAEEAKKPEQTIVQETQKVQEASAQSIVQNQAASGQAVIDYACQFIGNPYVWGGTSLTEGADCSGFVQSVYAHFGISLPRTTWDMENVGVAVSYEQALPGDIVLYDGHVGLYMGDGTIVNAMNEADGIGICSATYTNIITIRRVL